MKSKAFVWLTDTPKGAKCYYCGEPAIVSYINLEGDTRDLCAQCDMKKDDLSRERYLIKR